MALVRAPLDQAIVRKLLDYDPESGTLVWRWRGPEFSTSDRLFRSWNSRYAGDEAFTTVRPDGYRKGFLLGRSYLAHRVAYAHFHGVNPPADLDHIDGDRLNNRITNLRPVTHSQNMMNARPMATSSHLKGAHWSSRMRRWTSTIRASGVVHYLGSFPTEEQAHAAYRAASVKLHGQYGRVE